MAVKVDELLQTDYKMIRLIGRKPAKTLTSSYIWAKSFSQEFQRFDKKKTFNNRQMLFSWSSIKIKRSTIYYSKNSILLKFSAAMEPRKALVFQRVKYVEILINRQN